jgi:hypothetical protein
MSVIGQDTSSYEAPCVLAAKVNPPAAGGFFASYFLRRNIPLFLRHVVDEELIDKNDSIAYNLAQCSFFRFICSCLIGRFSRASLD